MATWKYWDDQGDEHVWVSADALPDGADLTRCEFIQQFYDAILERSYVAHLRTSSLFAYDASHQVVHPVDFVLTALPGNVEFGTAQLIAMQETIEELSYAFLHRGQFSYAFTEYDDVGPPTYRDDLISLQFLPYVFNTGNRATSTNSWRRKPTDDWPVYLEGQCETGDTIGPWVFEDLRRALYALRDVLVIAGEFETLYQRLSAPVVAMSHLIGINQNMQFSSTADEQWYLRTQVDVGSPFAVLFKDLFKTGVGMNQAFYSNVAGRTVQIDAGNDLDGEDGVTTVSYSGSINVDPTGSNGQGLHMAGWNIGREPDAIKSYSVSGSSNGLTWSSTHYTGPHDEGVWAINYYLYVHPNFAYL